MPFWFDFNFRKWTTPRQFSSSLEMSSVKDFHFTECKVSNVGSISLTFYAQLLNKWHWSCKKILRFRDLQAKKASRKTLMKVAPGIHLWLQSVWKSLNFFNWLVEDQFLARTNFIQFQSCVKITRILPKLAKNENPEMKYFRVALDKRPL